MRNPPPLLVVIAGAGQLLLAAVAMWVWETIPREADPEALPSRVLEPERRRPAGSARQRVVPVRRSWRFQRNLPPARKGGMRATRHKARALCRRVD